MTTVTDARANDLALVKLGENAVAKFLGDGRVQVTQGEVGSYRYRRVFDRSTLEAGLAAWENDAPRDRGLGVRINETTWAEYHQSHIDFVGEEIELFEGFGSHLGLDVKDVQHLISVMTH